MPHKTFNVAQVAEYLHLSRSDIEMLMRRGEIPFERQGAGAAVFRRKDVDAWASQRILGLSDKRLGDYHRVSSARVHDLSNRHTIIAELMRPEFIEPNLKSRTKPSVLRDMTALAEQTGLAYDPRDLLASLQAREALCSTALGDGVALLHPRHHEPYMFEDSFVALGRACNPLPFGAQDGRMTDIFFLVCCQDDRIHLHVLARICMMCSHTKLLDALRAAPDAAAMHEVIIQAEREVVALL